MNRWREAEGSGLNCSRETKEAGLDWWWEAGGLETNRWRETKELEADRGRAAEGSGLYC